MSPSVPAILLCLLLPFSYRPGAACAQGGPGTDDALTQAEVDRLRDTAFIPLDRLHVFQAALDDRTRALRELQAKRAGHTDFPTSAHDLLDQIGAIDDELNNNLDEYAAKHRDIRKALPRLAEATDHWTAAVNGLPESEGYAVVRRTALDDLQDTHDLLKSFSADLGAYFAAHPEAARRERQRADHPNAVEAPEQP